MTRNQRIRPGRLALLVLASTALSAATAWATGDGNLIESVAGECEAAVDLQITGGFEADDLCEVALGNTVLGLFAAVENDQKAGEFQLMVQTGDAFPAGRHRLSVACPRAAGDEPRFATALGGDST